MQYHDTVLGWATGKRSHLQIPLSAYIENCLLEAVSNDNVGVVLDILASGVFDKKRSLNPNACNEVRIDYNQPTSIWIMKASLLC